MTKYNKPKIINKYKTNNCNTNIIIPCNPRKIIIRVIPSEWSNGEMISLLIIPRDPYKENKTIVEEYI